MTGAQPIDEKELEKRLSVAFPDMAQEEIMIIATAIEAIAMAAVSRGEIKAEEE